MPPITWTDKKERDLLLAIVITNLAEQNDTDIRAKVNWGPVEKVMNRLGHNGVTTGSISQQFTKKILRDYKKSLKTNTDAGASDTGPASPLAAVKVEEEKPKPRTTKRKAKAAATAAADEEDYIDKEEEERERQPNFKPQKRVKKDLYSDED